MGPRGLLDALGGLFKPGPIDGQDGGLHGGHVGRLVDRREGSEGGGIDAPPAGSVRLGQRRRIGTGKGYLGKPGQRREVLRRVCQWRLAERCPDPCATLGVKLLEFVQAAPAHGRRPCVEVPQRLTQISLGCLVVLRPGR